jgi:hypothetical protein
MKFQTKVMFFIFLLSVMSCSWLNKKPLSQTVESTVPLPAKTETSETICTEAFQKTMSELNSKGSFQALFDFYKNNGKCMDAGYSEGIEAAISNTLDTHWKNLPELKKLFDTDQTFKKFFFDSMGCYVSGTEKSLQGVVFRAQNDCPQELTDLCLELKNEAEKELAYSKSQ